MLRLLLMAFVVTAPTAADAQTPLQTFAKRYQSESVTDPEKLQANPYDYADRNYTLRLRFVRIVGPAAAVFAGTGPKGQTVTVLLTKVPTKAFKGGEQLIAAVRVIGFTETSTFPEVELVGFEICKTPDCSEFDR